MLRVAGGNDIQYDADEFCLRFRRPDGQNMVANLGNVFVEWGGGQPAEVTEQIKRFVAMLVASDEVLTE